MEREFQISEFNRWVNELKQKVHIARQKVALSINSQLLELYWELGKELAEKQKYSDWGSNFIEQVATELKHEFPEIKGFSRRNLYAIKQWYQFYSEEYQFVPQDVAQIPWGHNRLIITKIKNVDEACFYCAETIKNGWDRDTLEIMITSNLYTKSGKATNNFINTLPEKQSKIVSQTFKDPYNFDFLGLYEDALEKAIEDKLVKHITQFLLELGKGFAFVGSQYKIEISDKDYHIDLLFYHLELRSYIVIELKSGKFKPEYVGKLNFYLSAVDSQLKKPGDNQSIGIILCKKKDKIEAEYALRDINKPMGISEYRLNDIIPEDFKTRLPSIEEMETGLTNKIRKEQDV
jgi:predicted nuclease of restriction endonuclease-like (RecB) superfamily